MSEFKIKILDLKRNITAKNDEIALSLRKSFAEAGLFVVNMLSGPGAGKTSLLEQMLKGLGPDIRCLIVEGDLRTARDAERIAGTGAKAIQIVTNGICHLDSRMLTAALDDVDLASFDALVIENVGNLVCPSSFDLGESARVVIGSVPEGEDKPEKYPFMFERAEVVILNKIDLIEHTPFNKSSFWGHVEKANPSSLRLETSCTTGEGIDRWLQWFSDMVGRQRMVAEDRA